MARLRIIVPALVLLGGALAFQGHASAGSDDAKIRASAHLYDTYCSQCHGVNRNGKGVNTVGLAVQPRDHSDTAGMSAIPRDEIIRAITDGGASVNKSALMPPWSSVLTHEQIEDMADYLNFVCKCGTAK